MTALPAAAVGPVGFLVGALLGFCVWRARLCSFGAIEDALMGEDWRRMKVFGLSLGIAMLGTQALVLAGVFDPALSTYIPTKLSWLPLAFGAILFGLGMALVGTCAFGSLIRLGGGDLRGLVTLIIFGAVAYAMSRGVLAPLRIRVVEMFAAPMPGESASALPDLLAHYGLNSARIGLPVLLGGFLIGAALRDRRLRHAPRLVTSGVALGFAVVAGWLATQGLVDSLEASVRTQSLTFVAPVGRAFFGLLLNAVDWSDFGVGTVFGVAFGAFIAARLADEFRWNAFDDSLEMRRHLIGAVLMGFGGVLAGGCTIGQGLTAGSLLALSWPVTLLGMLIGARIGIAVLIGEGWRDLMPRKT